MYNKLELNSALFILNFVLATYGSLKYRFSSKKIDFSHCIPNNTSLYHYKHDLFLAYFVSLDLVIKENHQH